jgi:hypothetical protein
MHLKLPAFRWQIQPGEPVIDGPVCITPMAATLHVGWQSAAFAWARPAGLLVEQNGQTERIDIPDVTRRIQAGLLGVGAAVTLAMWAKQSRDRSKSA